MEILNKNIIESIRSRYAAPTAESVASERTSRQGVMSRTKEKMNEALESTARDALETVAALTQTTRAARTEDQETPSLDFYEGQDIDATVDGEIAAESMRDSMPDTSPVFVPDSKDGQESAPLTAETEFEVPEYKVYSSPEEMSDLEILARTIEAEAASEGYEGRVAVGAVIANRAASGRMGKGIKGVILKKGQFSPWNSYTGYAGGEQGKDMLKLKPSDASYKAANAILTGNYEDKTKGATHYLNPDVSTPDWLPDMKSRKRGTISIGRHLFGNADNNKTYDGKAWVRENR